MLNTFCKNKFLDNFSCIPINRYLPVTKKVNEVDSYLIHFMQIIHTLNFNWYFISRPTIKNGIISYHEINQFNYGIYCFHAKYIVIFLIITYIIFCLYQFMTLLKNINIIYKRKLFFCFHITYTNSMILKSHTSKIKRILFIFYKTKNTYLIHIMLDG